jgi:hypothetical protein
MSFLRANRRPVTLAILSFLALGLHHVLLRAMAHGHTAHVLLAAGNGAPPAGAATLAVALVVTRFITVLLVPGLLLAAAAEVIAYLLVGPKRAASDETFDPLDDG